MRTGRARTRHVRSRRRDRPRRARTLAGRARVTHVVHLARVADPTRARRPIARRARQRRRDYERLRGGEAAARERIAGSRTRVQPRSTTLSMPRQATPVTRSRGRATATTLYGVHQARQRGHGPRLLARRTACRASVSAAIVYGPGRVYRHDSRRRRSPWRQPVRGEPVHDRLVEPLERSITHPDAARALSSTRRRAASERRAGLQHQARTVPMSEVVAAITAESSRRADRIRAESRFPFPEEFATGGFPMPVTRAATGVRETVELFRSAPRAPKVSQAARSALSRLRERSRLEAVGLEVRPTPRAPGTRASSTYCS